MEFTGLVLVNGFFTNARVNNVDVPQFVDTLTPAGAAGGTIRQTRLGVFVTDPDVLHGSFSGELDVDFYGGQQPSTGGRTFPLLRLRRAVGIVSWTRAQLLFGQESPLVAERSPRSLASVGFPDFAGAGNLWLWLPQFRATVEQGYTLRLAEQIAVLAPTAGTVQGLFNTQPDSAERSRRPYLQGLARRGRQLLPITRAHCGRPLQARSGRDPGRGIHRKGARRFGRRRHRAELRAYRSGGANQGRVGASQRAAQIRRHARRRVWSGRPGRSRLIRRRR
ncbi:MAG: hypothetical protein DMD67_16090 [Gemmatimonadetes bacterium]|nr:MAG: hypothetical protein DMD67_16090 [Gemmatimonadota bacterium]